MRLRSLLLLPLLGGGCAKRAYESAPVGGAYYSDDAPVPEMSRKEAAYDMEEADGRGRSAPAPRPATTSVSPSAPAATPSTPPTEAAPAAARMIYYNGWAQVRVADPQEAVDGLTAYVKSVDGYVESLSGTVLTVRVPVARFEEAFQKVLTTGELVRKSITAEDVTDAYTSVELRVRSLKSERERLVALLAKAKEEEEKLALLRQIQSVTEQLDQLEAQARVYQRLASYSRITIQLEARPTLSWSGGPDGSAFAWIRQLTPFADQLDGKKLPLPVPAGLVALDVKKRFAAESADGVRLWTDRRVNDPLGTSTFWIQSIQERLATDFASATVDTQGEWTRLRLVSREGPAYVWWILVRTDGKTLDVAQAYFPLKAQEEALGPKVLTSFGGAS